MKKVLCISMIILLFLMTSIHVVYAKEVRLDPTEGVESEPEEPEQPEEPDELEEKPEEQKNPEQSQSSGGVSTSILGDDFINEFKPGESNDGDPATVVATTVLNQVMPIVNTVLGIIQVFGIILTVISVAYFGFVLILANNDELLKPLGLVSTLARGVKDAPSDNKQIREWMWVVLIGAILLFMGSTIVRIVFSLLK